MKSKSVLLLTALAALVSIRYATDAWVQPALASSNAADGFTLAHGLSTALSGLQFLLGLATLACVILFASSFAEVLIKRGWTLVLIAGTSLALSTGGVCAAAAAQRFDVGLSVPETR